MQRASVFYLSACHVAEPSDARLDSEPLVAAAGAGFSGLLWRWAAAREYEPPEARGSGLRDLATRASAAGLRLIVEVDLARFPIDHPQAKARPEAFALRRKAPAHTPIDPRKEMPATGEALARVSSREAAETLLPLFEERCNLLLDSGVEGLRLTGAEHMSSALLPPLVERLRSKHPDVELVAGPLSGRASAAPQLKEAGFDFLVSALGRWDGRANWYPEELEELRRTAPVLCELDHKPRWAGGDWQGPLGAAAALAGGVIVPLEAAADHDMQAGLARARDAAGRLSAFDGQVRRLSAGAAPITALLKGDAADLRWAKEALLVLINPTATVQELPALSEQGEVGAEFGPWEPLAGSSTEAHSPLAPGEARVMTAGRREPVRTGRSERAEPKRDAARLVLERVSPCVEGGGTEGGSVHEANFPAKRVVGDTVEVGATIYTDGHEKIAAELRWRAIDEAGWSTAPMSPLPNDRWHAQFPLERLGRYEFVVEGWLDRFGGFRRDFATKLAAGVAQPVDHAEGKALVADAVQRCKGKLHSALKSWLRRLQDADEESSAALLRDDELAAAMAVADDRPHSRVSRPHLVDAERLEARFSSWYELFPRSQTDHPGRHGTFADVVNRLPAIRAMGFDTLYFPPIHPIGKTNRKGPNNTLTPGPDDLGSPYAIGSAEGGHDAIHPELGTFEDFDRLVAAAREQGLEVALDFAIQASPDHPWLREHPGWFAWRPDGSMKYAENPPKKYQDIVNVDFYGPDAVPGLWEALRDVVLLWVDHGVKTFRVDNPHTKPLPFWEWMIGDVRARHPEVIFLSEAFTRPTMMYRLAKIGFSQSYTYFTWRDGKHELTEYITELTTEAPKEFYRPHFFVNTPDINPFFLQTSGRPGFRIRAVLAATLSGLWGVYSGFELCEYEPLGPGKEEYLDSEKFEIRVRDWNAPGNIIADIALLNRLRRAHPALQTHLNTRFYAAYNDNIIWYGKPSPGGREMIMVMVNLDPHHAHECDFEVPLWEFGLGDNASIAVEDLAGGHRFDWHGKFQHIRLAPEEPYRIWRLSLLGAAE